MEAYFSKLANHPLFKGIPANLEEVLSDLNYKLRKYEKDEYMILTGDAITSIGILIQGGARIIREDIMGNSVIIASLHPGEIFAETFVCAGVMSSPVSVLAEESCTVVWIPLAGIINDSMGEDSIRYYIMTNLLKLLAGKNLYLNRKMEILSKRSIKEKFITYINFLAEENQSLSFFLPLNRNELAQYLCVDRSALSREIMKLKKEEIISFEKNKITILVEPD